MADYKHDTYDEYECKCGSTKISVFAPSGYGAWTEWSRTTYTCRSCGRTGKANIKPISGW